MFTDAANKYSRPPARPVLVHPIRVVSAHLPPSAGLVGLHIVDVDGVHTELRKAQFTRWLPVAARSTSASTRN